MFSRILNWLSCVIHGGTKPACEQGETVHWVRGIGWVKSSTQGILPSKYKTKEEWKTFKRSVDKIAREAANHSGGSFPGITL